MQKKQVNMECNMCSEGQLRQALPLRIFCIGRSPAGAGPFVFGRTGEIGAWFRAVGNGAQSQPRLPGRLVQSEGAWARAEQFQLFDARSVK